LGLVTLCTLYLSDGGSLSFLNNSDYLSTEMIEEMSGSFDPIVEINFNEPSVLEDWKEHVFKGRSSFEILQNEDGSPALKSASKAASSALFRKVNVDVSDHPVLRWEWKVTKFPSNKENKVLAARKDNDYGARVYAVFGKTLMTSKVIQYIWDDHFPEGTYNSSGFSPRVKTLVIKTTVGDVPKEWSIEHRDLAKDYKMLFGKVPKKKLSAIGIMSDSDNTGTESEAFLRNISILRPISS